MASIVSGYPQFFTATILKWKHLLSDDKYKKVITDTLTYMVKQKKIIVYCFVIMPNHIHLIWQTCKGHERANIQRDLLKYISYLIIKDLTETNETRLNDFRVNASDRKFQIWERNPLSTDIFSKKTFFQKMDYIHNNPIQEKWKLCNRPKDYHYSSASLYEKGILSWDFLTPYPI